MLYNYGWLNVLKVAYLWTHHLHALHYEWSRVWPKRIVSVSEIAMASPCSYQTYAPKQCGYCIALVGVCYRTAQGTHIPVPRHLVRRTIWQPNGTSFQESLHGRCALGKKVALTCYTVLELPDWCRLAYWTGICNNICSLLVTNYNFP